jgi:hypothetical protein
MKLRILAALCGLLSFSHLSAETFRYHETTGTEVSEPAVNISWNDALGVYEFSSDDRYGGIDHRMKLNADFSAREWTSTLKDGSIITYSREGDSLLVRGRLSGAEVGESRKIDRSPWFASLEFGLGEFIRSGKKDISFWVIMQDKFKIYKMTASRLGKEDVPVNGNITEAVRVRVTVDGVPAVFFSYSFWFAEPDGLFLRFEGTNGKPGTPKTITQFMRKE